MIKIIKDGQKEFIGNCNICGCQFSYDIDDIPLGSVPCPCCGHYYVHKNIIPDTAEILQEYSITTTDPKSIPISATAKL